MYTVSWGKHKHEIDTGETIYIFRDFSAYEKAKAFLLTRFLCANIIYWAGGHIEDEHGKWVL